MAEFIVERTKLPFNRYLERGRIEGEGEFFDIPAVEFYRAHGKRYRPKEGEIDELYGVEFLVIELKPTFCYRCARIGVDGFMAIRWKRFMDVWIEVKIRLILTAYVWGCADLKNGYEIRWSDLCWPWSKKDG